MSRELELRNPGLEDEGEPPWLRYVFPAYSGEMTDGEGANHFWLSLQYAPAACSPSNTHRPRALGKPKASWWQGYVSAELWIRAPAIMEKPLCIQAFVPEAQGPPRWTSFPCLSKPSQIVFVCLFVFCFLGLHLWHMEVPRLGVKMELHLPAYATATGDPSRICNLHQSSQQCWIPDLLNKTRDWNCILTNTSLSCFCCATTGTPKASQIVSPCLLRMGHSILRFAFHTAS